MLILGYILVGCGPSFRQTKFPNKSWTAVLVGEIPHKDFGFPQRCLFDHDIPYTSDYFDDDEPESKPIALWVEKAKLGEAKRLLQEDAKDNHYSLKLLQPKEKTVDPL